MFGLSKSNVHIDKRLVLEITIHWNGEASIKSYAKRSNVPNTMEYITGGKRYLVNGEDASTIETFANSLKSIPVGVNEEHLIIIH